MDRDTDLGDISIEEISESMGLNEFQKGECRKRTETRRLNLG